MGRDIIKTELNMDLNECRLGFNEDMLAIDDVLGLSASWHGDTTVKAADARSLYYILGGNRHNFARDMRLRISEYNASEGLDYEIVLSRKNDNKKSVGRPGIDYNVTIEFAKFIALRGTKVGSTEIAKYFIEVERYAQHLAAGKLNSSYGGFSNKSEVLNATEIAGNLLTTKTKALSSSLKELYGDSASNGYKYKMLLGLAEDVKEETSIDFGRTLAIGVPEEPIGHRETMDPTEDGQVYIRNAGENTEIVSSANFARRIGVSTTRRLNIVLLTLGYQELATDVNGRPVRGKYLAGNGMKKYSVTAISLASSKTAGKSIVQGWNYKAFSAIQIQEIKDMASIRGLTEPTIDEEES